MNTSTLNAQPKQAIWFHLAAMIIICLTTFCGEALALQSGTGINRSGNTVEYVYDGLNRRIAVVQHLRLDGQGKNPIDPSNPANPDGLVVTDTEYDANSRLVPSRRWQHTGRSEHIHRRHRAVQSQRQRHSPCLR